MELKYEFLMLTGNVMFITGSNSTPYFSTLLKICVAGLEVKFEMRQMTGSFMKLVG